MDQPLINGAEDAIESYRTHSLNNGNVVTEVNQAKLDQANERLASLASQGIDNPGASKRTYSLATREGSDQLKLVKQAQENCKNPIKLSWHNICFEVEIKQTKDEVAATGQEYRRQEIVKGATGFASPGQAAYIMGASGAGKTSLLNILADRVKLINKATISGTILFNDEIPLNQETYARYAAYVMQDDILFSHFTVREALIFAARLKLTTPNAEQDALVDNIQAELGLMHLTHSQIGDVRRKILSGGERKRTSIGVELVSDPSLVMLDEPTSGLDSFKARSICRLLHDLARKKGKCIVSTIHQPSSEAFYYFDRVILMADGYTVFQGDAAESLEYFRAMGEDVPKLCNPADYFMKVLAINYPKGEADEKKLKMFQAAYRSSVENRVKIDNQLIKLPLPSDYAAGLSAYHAPITVQLEQLFYRSWIFASREPRIGRAKILQTVVICGFMIPVFWQLNDYNGENPDKKISHTEAKFDANTKALMNQYSMVGAMYFVTFMQMLLNFLPTVIIFQGEKPIFIRERAGNMYDIWVYATTKMFAEIPIMLFNPALLLVLIYFAIGFCNYISEFAQFYLILALMTQAAAAMGYFLSSAFNSETAAVAFVPIINMPLSLLGGYMINLKSIKGKYPQAIIEWVQYISPVRYCFNGLMQSQWNTYCNNPPNGLSANVNACGSAVNGVTIKKSLIGFYGTTLTYFGCCSGLLFLWIFNRGWVIISLTLQDANCACGADQNDTRNTKPKAGAKDAVVAAEAENALNNDE